jgi:DNA-binding LacI/PurR family transcriptional regulator
LSDVDVEHRAGAALAARHLLSLGRRRLATISGPLDVPASQERLTGFREVAGDTVNVEGNFTVASGEEAMAALLDQAPDLDAVFAANDLLAAGALRVLKAAGRKVPDDVALVGFDDSSIARHTEPQLTSVRQPIEDLGRNMAKLLLMRLENSDVVPEPVVLPTELIVRQSA